MGVAFLDPDELWEPDALRILTDVLVARPDVVGVHGYTCAFDADGRSLGETGLHDLQMRRVGVDGWRARVWPLERATEFSVLALQDCVGLSSALFRRAMVEQVGGFDADLHHFEDWSFLFRVTLCGPLAFTSAPVARKRDHDANVSNDAAIMWRGLRDVRRQLITLVRGDAERHRVALLGQRFSHRLNLGRDLRHAGDSLHEGAPRQALWHLRRALLCGVKDMALGGCQLLGLLATLSRSRPALANFSAQNRSRRGAWCARLAARREACRKRDARREVPAEERDGFLPRSHQSVA